MPARLGFPVREESVTQIGSGTPGSDYAVVTAEDVGLIRARHADVKSVGVTVLHPTHTGIALPVFWRGDYVLNGDAATTSDMYMPGELDSFHIRGRRRDTVGVTLPRQAFIATIAALSGVGPDEIALTERLLSLSVEDAALVRRRLISLIDAACDAAKPLGAREAVNAGYTLMADAYLKAAPSPGEGRKHGWQPSRVVRKAEDRFVEAGARPVSLADLCVAAGVSKSTLYAAFDNVCGESPLSYFRKRRLTLARSILLQARRKRGAVTEAATSAGLTELGRFAAEYRRLFGESPSATLTSTAS